MRSSLITQRYGIPDHAPLDQPQVVLSAMSHAVSHCSPDFMITNDEILLFYLSLAQEKLQNRPHPLSYKHRKLLTFLNRCLLDNTDLYMRYQGLNAVQKAGFPTPQSGIAATTVDALKIVKKFQGNCFVKANYSLGGFGVYSGQDIDLCEQWLDQQYKNNGFKESNPILIQEKCEGTELTVSFAAWDGELLGYVVVDPIKKAYADGPSSVISNRYRPNWLPPLQKLIQSMNYSGFGGMDVFETTPDKLPTVIELNARSTHSIPASPLLNNNLIKLLYDRLNNQNMERCEPLHVDNNKTVALFPEEVMRDPTSKYLQDVPLEAPWTDPKLMQKLTEHLEIDLSSVQ
jgi:hypothetical protein